LIIVRDQDEGRERSIRRPTQSEPTARGRTQRADGRVPVTSDMANALHDVAPFTNIEKPFDPAALRALVREHVASSPRKIGAPS
jgi:hypothetical protein